ncbi:MAG: FtsW/RodA/SpoVE family cell cycle protein, partial [Candidatus Omnitrophica bacterium]|nr:FtsW/RodA/SpoVE family cell cycle protein [Candidatus Omnitrophota bacterium]
MREIRSTFATLFMILISIGIVMIYSSSGIYASQELGDPMFFLKRHFLFLFVGAVLMMGMMAFDYRDLRRYAKPLLIVTVLLLVLVLIPGIGKSSSGARRWFRIGPINFQPSELVKPVLIIYLADFLTRKKSEVRSFTTAFMPVMIVMGILCLLIIKQPDLGNT